MDQDVNRHHVDVRQRVHLSAAQRRLMLVPLIAQRTRKIRLMLLDVVLAILDGIEAALSSAADALIQPLLLQRAIFSASYAVAGVLGAFQI